MKNFILFIKFGVKFVSVEVFADITPLSEQAGPQLDPDDAKDEEDEEAQEQHIPQHGEGVKEKHNQNPHA